MCWVDTGGKSEENNQDEAPNCVGLTFGLGCGLQMNDQRRGETVGSVTVPAA